MILIPAVIVKSIASGIYKLVMNIKIVEATEGSVDSLFKALAQWGLSNAAGRRATSGLWKVRRGCKHCFKNLIPVYMFQLPVYPLIGLF